MGKLKNNFSFNLSLEMKEWLDDEAKRQDRTVGWLIRSYIQEKRDEQIKKDKKDVG